MNLKPLALAALLAGTAALPACSSGPVRHEDDPGALPPLASPTELADLGRRLQPNDYTITLAGLRAGPYKNLNQTVYWHRYGMVWQAPAGMQRDSTPWTRITEEQYNDELPLEGLAVATRQNGKDMDEPVAPEMAFVGNPTYGHWTRGPRGDSFWEWYGKYAMMRDLFGSSRRPIVIHRTEYNTYRRDPGSYRSSRPEMPSFRRIPEERGFGGKVAGAMSRPVVSRSGAGWRSSRSTTGGSSGSAYAPPRASSSYGSRGSGGSGYYSPPRSSYGTGRSYSPPSTRSSGWGRSSRSGRRH
jgi:hypothetical protein